MSGGYVLAQATRVEVIDATGRVFVGRYEPGVTVAIQDDGRTVKVFAGAPTTLAAFISECVVAEMRREAAATPTESEQSNGN